ncbi:MAG: guanylate kinase [Bacteroidetes bacterium]|nr:guanylate kinase [Bacteroidota bacterium]MCL2303642.1 guanylate kinase [Lentimicrobiaceae bacterium]
MERGKLIIFAAPSGSGKTSIVKYLLAQHLPLTFSISATTRPKRPNEEEGVDYFFLTPKQFQEKIVAGDFLEWEEVYAGAYYGTLKSEVDKLLEKGENVIFDVDVLGALNIKKIYAEQALALFVKPPSVEALKERLKIRGTECAESLKRRIDKATYELSFAPDFDITIINDHLEEAQSDAKQIVLNFIK